MNIFRTAPLFFTTCIRKNWTPGPMFVFRYNWKWTPTFSMIKSPFWAARCVLSVSVVVSVSVEWRVRWDVKCVFMACFVPILIGCQRHFQRLGDLPVAHALGAERTLLFAIYFVNTTVLWHMRPWCMNLEPRVCVARRCETCEICCSVKYVLDGAHPEGAMPSVRLCVSLCFCRRSCIQEQTHTHTHTYIRTEMHTYTHVCTHLHISQKKTQFWAKKKPRTSHQKRTFGISMSAATIRHNSHCTIRGWDYEDGDSCDCYGSLKLARDKQNRFEQ